MLSHNVGTCTAFPHYGPFGACLNCLIGKIACHTHCTYVGDAFGAHVGYGFASDRAFQMTVGTDGRGIYDRLGQRNACTSDACLYSTCKRTLSRSAHKGRNPVLLELVLYEKNIIVFRRIEQSSEEAYNLHRK